MRIGKQMLEVADSHTQIVSLLKEVGVPDPARRVNAYPHELSGGLRQRVMIAIAIAQEPRLIVADEPTTALDVTVQAQILGLFARLRREHGCSIVLITHDLAVASQIADRVAVLYGGRIAEIGPTTDCSIGRSTRTRLRSCRADSTPRPTNGTRCRRLGASRPTPRLPSRPVHSRHAARSPCRLARQRSRHSRAPPRATRKRLPEKR